MLLRKSNVDIMSDMLPPTTAVSIMFSTIPVLIQKAIGYVPVRLNRIVCILIAS